MNTTKQLMTRTKAIAVLATTKRHTTSHRLAVAYQGVAFPLLWTLLPKQGNSNTTERIDLVAQLLKLFPRNQIGYLTADREFVGRGWIQYLLK